MKTKRVAARLKPLDINKIARYFNHSTLRAILEALIVVSEENSYVKKKINEKISKNKGL